MANTQDGLNIADITDDIILLKDGGGALVIRTSAVNFGLLSEIEQLSIIAAFAQMLNSLSFAIQIVIQSQKLDISSYIGVLDRAQKTQANPLLVNLIGKYKNFIQSTIKENEVLDKQFYIAIPVSYLEVGLGYSDKQDRIKKIKTILLPRKDQLFRQLNRVGLKAIQLNNSQLIKIFFDIYNQTGVKAQMQGTQLPAVEQVKLTSPRINTPTAQPIIPTGPTIAPISDVNIQGNQISRTPRNHPFVVEELSDSI